MKLELLKRRRDYPEMVSKYPYLNELVELAESELIEAKAIIQKLRTNIKGKESSPTDLQLAIHGAFSRAGLPENIQVELLMPNRTIWVTANDRLLNVFWNLIDNARKAMPDGGHLKVTASISPNDPWVNVEVKDTGRGIEPWRLSLIFEADETTTKDPNAPGHGLGLWWVKAQLANFGGQVAVESEIGVGTCVTVKLKKAA